MRLRRRKFLQLTLTGFFIPWLGINEAGAGTARSATPDVVHDDSSSIDDPAIVGTTEYVLDLAIRNSQVRVSHFNGRVVVYTLDDGTEACVMDLTECYEPLLDRLAMLLGARIQKPWRQKWVCRWIKRDDRVYFVRTHARRSERQREILVNVLPSVHRGR